MRLAANRITSDLFLVLTSLLIALVIWMIAKRGEIESVTIGVKLRFVNQPEDVEAELPDKDIRVSVSFSPALRELIQPGNFVVEVDWNDLYPLDWCGISEFGQSPNLTLSARDVQPMPSLEPAMKERLSRYQTLFSVFEPNKVAVRAKFITRPVQINFRHTGIPAEGFRLAEDQPFSTNVGRAILLRASPAVFKSLGAKNESDPVTVATEPIDVDGKRESFASTVRLRLHEDTQLVHPKDHPYEVRVSIAEIIDIRDIEGVRIVVEPRAADLEVSYEPALATVSVRGPQSKIGSLTVSDFRVQPDGTHQEKVFETSRVSLEASFAESVSPEIKEKVAIQSVTPESLELRFSEKAGVSPTAGE